MHVNIIDYLFTSCQKLNIKKITILPVITLSMMLGACSGTDKAEVVPTDHSDAHNHSDSHDHLNTHHHASKMNHENPDVVIATDPTNMPFEMTNENGHIIGLNADIINAIAEDQNFTYDFKSRKWQGIFEEIDNGKSDIISGLVVTNDERLQKYDFTDPLYFKKRYAYMKNETANKHEITEFADICNLKVAVKAKTDKSALYDSVCGTENKNKVSLSSSYTAFEKMASGSVDVAIGDDVLFSYLMKDNGLTDLSTVADPTNETLTLAWPVKKGNTELLHTFNTGLKNLKASGEYKKLVHKWLGEDFTINN